MGANELHIEVLNHMIAAQSLVVSDNTNSPNISFQWTGWRENLQDPPHISW
jgi:hypothetical protein